VKTNFKSIILNRFQQRLVTLMYISSGERQSSSKSLLKVPLNIFSNNNTKIHAILCNTRKQDNNNLKAVTFAISFYN